jgi:hypothetical protein
MPAPPSSIPAVCRWDVVSAAREFGMMKETLARKLNQSGQVPGADKRYSTQQLIASIFGDIASARLKETLERGDHWRLKNEILRGELLPKSLLTPALEQVFPHCLAADSEQLDDHRGEKGSLNHHFLLAGRGSDGRRSSRQAKGCRRRRDRRRKRSRPRPRATQKKSSSNFRARGESTGQLAKATITEKTIENTSVH